jgi:pyruvate kinase
MNFSVYTKTKIVATIGPSSSSKKILEEMIIAGVNVFRINFSHGTYDDHAKVIKNVRDLNKKMGTHIAILADLQGPKLRIGEMKDDGAELLEGKDIRITTEKCIGTSRRIYTNYEKFPSDVKAGDRVLLDDGKIIIQVTETDGQKEVIAKIIQGGKLSSNKGMNLPNTNVSLPCLTAKDLKDLEFALESDVEWLGLSFVRSARDIIELKHLIANYHKKTRVIAKIEKPEALKHIDAIIKETDGIMVARGDLGVEMPMESVPFTQKNIVRKCMDVSKPVIIATQMMESMIENLSPNRAEVNDVANSVMDGADALMLSGETSVGKHPVKVIENMKRIIVCAEHNPELYNLKHTPEFSKERYISDSICFTACKLAEQSKAKGIVTMTNSGYSAFKVASHRPNCIIFIFTENQTMLNTLNLVWGVKGFFYNKYVSTDHTIADIKFKLKEEGWVEEGDLIINIASIPIMEKGQSNVVKLSTV